MNKKAVISLMGITAFFIFSLHFSLPAVAASPKSQTEVQTYDQLLQAVREIRKPGRLLTRQGVVSQAWTIGKLVENHIALHQMWSDYDGYITPKLAKDSGIFRRELYQMRQFARYYPEAAPARNLTWRHYLEVLRFDDPVQREAILERSEKEQWSTPKLMAELKKIPHKKTKAPKGAPQKFDLYRVVKMENSGSKNGLALELGFANYRSLEAENLFKEGDIVNCRPACKADPKAGIQDLYAYRATVLQVVDGDTFDALIDLGFGIKTRQKFRLGGLNAPEMDTPKGVAAKEFFYHEMVKHGGRVILRAGKLDKYNRNLADLWVEEDGVAVSVNQKLLGRGFATSLRK